MYHSGYDSRNRTFIRGGRVADGTVVWKIKDIRCPYSLGEFVFKMNEPKDYEYLLLCDGSTISEENYPELVAVLGGTQLQNLIDRFLQGAATAGTYKEAGLPNITGTLTDTPEVRTQYGGTGAFSVKSFNQGVGTNGISPGDNWIGKPLDTVIRNFDASRSNSIYGNSDIVQPAAFTAKIYICFAG